MGPAGATVLGDVLVADVGDHVLAVDVVPFPHGGEVVDGSEGSVDKARSSHGGGSVTWVLGVDVAATKGKGAEEGSDSEGFHG